MTAMDELRMTRTGEDTYSLYVRGELCVKDKTIPELCAWLDQKIKEQEKKDVSAL